MSEYEILEVTYVPSTVRRRKQNLDLIVQELNRRNFRSLDETNKDDLSHVMSIVQDMFPENTERLVKEYSQVAIRLWKRQKTAN
jgi:hypothetical protein